LKSSFVAWRLRPEIISWIEEAALFDAICNIPNLVGKDWWDWPEDLRRRDPTRLKEIRASASMDIEEFYATQFLFDKQWLTVKSYANSQGISIIGDMPIYVGGHSADVWANQSLFLLGKDCKPTSVAGVPPDAFSEDGQLWGNPLYDWRSHSEDNYRWWAGRIGRALQLHDEVRIDHFRAFAAYWSVAADAKTAKNGAWMVGPGKDFFDGIEKAVGDAPIVAEDLGVITEDVVNLRESINAPGMAVLQFAWGGDSQSPHLPHNMYENSFCYPGTHDNQTTEGWFESLDEATKLKLAYYAGISEAEGAAWGLIRLGMSGVSKACVFTMQDVLGLGDEARMNTPGVADGNWAWRVGPPGIFSTYGPQAKRLSSLAICFDRVANERMINAETCKSQSSETDNSQVAADDVSKDADSDCREKRFFGIF
jgi:4-alpha-glucanotransferase